MNAVSQYRYCGTFWTANRSLIVASTYTRDVPESYLYAHEPECALEQLRKRRVECQIEIDCRTEPVLKNKISDDNISYDRMVLSRVYMRFRLVATGDMWQKSVESAEFRSISAMQNVKKPLVANIDEDDEVLILTDTDHDPEVWKLLATAVRDLGGVPIISLFETPEMDYYNPPAGVASQMLEVDVVITCTTTAMLHSPAGDAAMEAGVPIIAMDGGITMDMLTKGAATADYKRIEQLEYEIGKKVFEGGSEARLTSEYGTDLTLSIEDRVFLYRKPDPDTIPLEVYEKRPGFRAVVFPRGEFNVPPNPSTADGTIVFDTTMHHLGYLEEPIELEITAGTITNIDGGYQAQELERVLEKYGDEDAYRMPTEFSVGANPEARVTGCQREDKNMLGCIHIGLGTNADVGGEIHSKLHMDGVIARPTLEIDGEVMIDRGDILPIDV